MKGSSSLTSCRLLILSRLLSSLIWARLTLFVPALGIRVPLPQNGAPIHRVRAHSRTGIRIIHDLHCAEPRLLPLSHVLPLLKSQSNIHWLSVAEPRCRPQPGSGRGGGGGNGRQNSHTHSTQKVCGAYPWSPHHRVHRVLALSAFDILLNKYFPAG